MRFVDKSYEDVISYAGIKASPCGAYLSFTASHPDLDNNRTQSDIIIWNVAEEKEVGRIANAAGGFWIDDNTLAFTALRDAADIERAKKEDFTVVYKIDVRGGEAVRWCEVPMKLTGIWKLGDKLLVRSKVNHNPEGDGDFEKWVTYIEYPYHAEGRNYVNKIRTTFFRFDPACGELKQISDDNCHCNEVLNNPADPYIFNDEKEVYFWGDPFVGRANPTHILYHYNDETGVTTQVTEMTDYSINSGISFGGKVYFHGYDMFDDPDRDFNTDIVVLDEEARNLKPVLKPDLGRIRTLNASEKWIWLPMCERARSGLWTWVPGNEPEVYYYGDYELESLCYVGERVFALARKGQGLSELVEVFKGSVKQLTDNSAPFLAKYEINVPENMIIDVEGGFLVEGWVLKPVGYEPGKKYPGILHIHGGPQSHYNDLLFPAMQRLSEAGYFVFYSNPRGGDTYGRAHMKLDGNYGTYDFENLMSFTDAVLEKYPDIDADRLGVTGGSYGGYMTNWIIGHTNRFKAAVSCRSISNWISMFGCTDISWFPQFGQQGTPWRDVGNMWRSSPLRYADQCTTPTLFIQNNLDYRCPVEQAEQMFSALLHHNIPAKMILNKGVSHFNVTPKVTEHDCIETIAWFDKYCK